MRFPPIVLVGCGRMGRAMLASWLREGVPPGQITVIEQKEHLAAIDREFHVDVAETPTAETLQNAGILVLAVKPQMLGEVLKIYQPILKKETLVITVAAGKSLGFYAAALGDDKAVVRAMPNLPATIGKGVTGLIKNNHVTPTQEMQAERLFTLLGSTVWVTEEEKMHALTAVSGSGPAYVFYFMQLMVESAVKAGFDKEQAEILVRSTVEGAVLLANQSKESLEDLRRNVTSPGGTTAAAMEAFQKDEAFETLVEKAVNAAIARGKELA